MMRRYSRGLTLIELLITLAVLAILLTMAWPTYTRHVQRVERAQAIEALLSEASHQEQLRAVSGQYQPRSPGTLARGRYRLSIAISNQGRSYELTATPLNAQLHDSCGAMTLDDQGVRSSEGDDLRCWSGR